MPNFTVPLRKELSRFSTITASVERVFALDHRRMGAGHELRVVNDLLRCAARAL